MFLYIKAHMTRSLRWIVISLVFFAVLTFYSWYVLHIEMKQKEIEDAYDRIEVKMELTDISGTSTVDLGIVGNILIPFFKDDFVFAGEEYRGIDSYIEDRHLELGILYQFYEGISEFNSLNAKKLKGVSNIEQSYAFRAGTGVSIRYEAGYDASLFLYVPRERREPTCVIPEAKRDRVFFAEDGREKVRLLIAPHADPKRSLDLEFFVAGAHNADDETIYCPFILADALFDDLTSASNHDGAEFLKQYRDSNKTYPIMKLDAAGAVIKDNRNIAELKKLLKHYYHEVDISIKRAEQSLFDGNRTVAYMIYDEQLNRTVGLLNKNLKTLQRLFPIFSFLEIATLFTVFYFYFHTRKRELALSRVLGFSRKTTMVASVLETLVMCLPGTVLYIVVSDGIHIDALVVAVATALLGAVASIVSHTRISRVLKLSTAE